MGTCGRPLGGAAVVRGSAGGDVRRLRVPTARWHADRGAWLEPSSARSAGSTRRTDAAPAGLLAAGLDRGDGHRTRIRAWEFNAPADTMIAGTPSSGSSARRRLERSEDGASVLYHDAPVFDGGARAYRADALHAVSIGCSGWGDEASAAGAGQSLFDARASDPATHPHVRVLSAIRSASLPVRLHPATAHVAVHASQIATRRTRIAPAFTAAPAGALLRAAARSTAGAPHLRRRGSRWRHRHRRRSSSMA